MNYTASSLSLVVGANTAPNGPPVLAASNASAPTAPNTSPSPGQPVSATFKVINNGTGTATAPWSDSVYVGTSSTSARAMPSSNASHTRPTFGARRLLRGDRPVLPAPRSQPAATTSSSWCPTAAAGCRIRPPTPKQPRPPSWSLLRQISATGPSRRESPPGKTSTSRSRLAPPLIPGSASTSQEWTCWPVRECSRRRFLGGAGIGVVRYCQLQPAESSPGVWYIDLHGEDGAGAPPGESVTITAAAVPLGVTHVEPSTEAQSGQVGHCPARIRLGIRYDGHPEQLRRPTGRLQGGCVQLDLVVRQLPARPDRRRGVRHHRRLARADDNASIGVHGHERLGQSGHGHGHPVRPPSGSGGPAVWRSRSPTSATTTSRSPSSGSPPTYSERSRRRLLGLRTIGRAGQSELLLRGDRPRPSIRPPARRFGDLPFPGAADSGRGRRRHVLLGAGRHERRIHAIDWSAQLASDQPSYLSGEASDRWSTTSLRKWTRPEMVRGSPAGGVERGGRMRDSFVRSPSAGLPGRPSPRHRPGCPRIGNTRRERHHRWRKRT